MSNKQGNDLKIIFNILFLFVSAYVTRYLIYSITDNEIEYKSTYFLFFYPMIFVIFILWMKIIDKKSFKPIILRKPTFPTKGHRWFWILMLLFLIFSYSTLYFVFKMKWAYFDEDFPGYYLFFYIHTLFYAPIFEEIIFRGYYYNIGEEVWQNNSIFFKIEKPIYNPENKKQTKLVQQYAIPYAALFSSFIFALWHMNPLHAFFAFFGGLIFCKAKNDTNKSLFFPVIIHFAWNLLFGMIQNTTFPYIADFLLGIADFFMENLW